jgi:1,4-dihydroxy-2-naphthoate octaprenyltransferase
LILAGVIALVSFYLLDIASFSATWPVAMLLVVVAFAVMIFISSGMNKDRIDEIEEQEKWQKLTPKMRKNIELSGKICGTIMLLATAIYLLMGFAFGGWVVYWFVFPIGGIMCGIVGTILNADIPKALGEK